MLHPSPWPIFQPGEVRSALYSSWRHLPVNEWLEPVRFQRGASVSAFRRSGKNEMAWGPLLAFGRPSPQRSSCRKVARHRAPRWRASPLLTCFETDPAVRDRLIRYGRPRDLDYDALLGFRIGGDRIVVGDLRLDQGMRGDIRHRIA